MVCLRIRVRGGSGFNNDDTDMRGEGAIGATGWSEIDTGSAGRG